MKHITMTHQMSSTYKIYAMLHLKVMLKYLIKIEYKLRSGKIIIIITRNLPSIRDAHILFILYLKTNMIFTNYNYHNTTDMQAVSGNSCSATTNLWERSHTRWEPPKHLFVVARRCPHLHNRYFFYRI